MNEPVAYLNGRWIPASQAVVSVADAGFVLGATVSEQLRSCGGRLFQLEPHLDRFEQSLALAGIDPGLSREKLSAILYELTHRNHALLELGDDLGLAMFCTPGPYATLALDLASGPTIGLHTYPLPFRLWSDSYRTGTKLVTVDIEPVPETCWPVTMKCRSRMHYYLADRAARAKQPGARAVLVDALGRVHDTSTATVLAFFAHEGLVVPPPQRILPGISAKYVRELAAALGVGWTERDVSVTELATADELLLASTPFCLLSVTQLDGASIGAGRPGPLFQRLIALWSERVGLDIVEQSQRFEQRGFP